MLKDKTKLLSALKNLNSMIQFKIENQNYKEETLINECLEVSEKLQYGLELDFAQICDYIEQATNDLTILEMFNPNKGELK